jgi:hypothetical protein
MTVLHSAIACRGEGGGYEAWLRYVEDPLVAHTFGHASSRLAKLVLPQSPLEVERELGLNMPHMSADPDPFTVMGLAESAGPNKQAMQQIWMPGIITLVRLCARPNHADEQQNHSGGGGTRHEIVSRTVLVPENAGQLAVQAWMIRWPEEDAGMILASSDADRNAVGPVMAAPLTPLERAHNQHYRDVTLMDALPSGAAGRVRAHVALHPDGEGGIRERIYPVLEEHLPLIG